MNTLSIKSALLLQPDAWLWLVPAIPLVGALVSWALALRRPGVRPTRLLRGLAAMAALGPGILALARWFPAHVHHAGARVALLDRWTPGNGAPVWMAHLRIEPTLLLEPWSLGGVVVASLGTALVLFRRISGRSAVVQACHLAMQGALAMALLADDLVVVGAALSLAALATRGFAGIRDGDGDESPKTKKNLENPRELGVGTLGLGAWSLGLVAFTLGAAALFFGLGGSWSPEYQAEIRYPNLSELRGVPDPDPSTAETLVYAQPMAPTKVGGPDEPRGPQRWVTVGATTSLRALDDQLSLVDEQGRNPLVVGGKLSPMVKPLVPTRAEARTIPARTVPTVDVEGIAARTLWGVPLALVVALLLTLGVGAFVLSLLPSPRARAQSRTMGLAGTAIGGGIGVAIVLAARLHAFLSVAPVSAALGALAAVLGLALGGLVAHRISAGLEAVSTRLGHYERAGKALPWVVMGLALVLIAWGM